MTANQSAKYQKFTVDVSTSPDSQTTVYKVAGYMNELAEIRLVGITAPATPKVQIDGEGVTAVNSSGVSGWSQFVRRLAGRCKVDYVRLATVFLNQLDMVPSLRPDGVMVKSFFVGYECGKCDRTQQMLMERGTHYGPG